ncbi:FkbM family methyltransferase [Alloacidobacterium sp.]|uniref:FkbM family methyltransferase n=1 Tax=Alloacidobacterium sp. TaxID=2951999 RepID=UPI002D5A3876|nr:FkbM family methyltransferase [Alloacidobacterium sp.]HYK34527.1 FkbM family methyltransferase [Alloacidobacterium sp.]
MNMNRVNNFVHYCARASHTVGIIPTCQWIFGTVQYNLNFSSPRFVRVWPRFLDHPVKLRARTSDPFVFRQIMIENEYAPLGDLKISSILDLGANIGLSSAWFLNRFPNVRVFAVEADADNYTVCSENLAPYRERAQVVRGAAWSRHATLVLRWKSCAANIHVHERGTEDVNEVCVEAWDIANLIRLSGFERVDLVKIDVEGVELEIFRSNIDNWLPFVRNLCIELHSQACRDTFFAALSSYEYQHLKSGELDICMNLRPKNDPQGAVHLAN